MNKEKKLLMERNQQLYTLQELMEDHKERLLELRDTINFYSEELSATIEHQCFFKSLAQHYLNITNNMVRISHTIKGDDYE